MGRPRDMEPKEEVYKMDPSRFLKEVCRDGHPSYPKAVISLEW